MVAIIWIARCASDIQIAILFFHTFCTFVVYRSLFCFVLTVIVGAVVIDFATISTLLHILCVSTQRYRF